MSIKYDIKNRTIVLWDEQVIHGEIAICEHCRGSGSTVNPSIDGNGLSSEDFAEDPDFKEAYFRGDYDVHCPVCHGTGRIVQPTDPKDVQAVQEYFQSEAQYRAEVAAERRMGA